MEKIFLRLFVPALCCICLGSAMQAQTIRFVKQGAVGGGTSWGNASGDFQAMVNASAVNDEVWVAAGDYQTNPGTPFMMKEGVKIYGGFPNTGSPGIGNRNWATNISRLIGRQLIENGPSSCRVISNIDNGLTVAAVLDGFTICNGYALDHGGGMRNQNVSPTIRNCTFSGNSAVGNGGGMHNSNSHPVILNCIFSNNVNGFFNTYGNGAGIFNEISNPAISNCEFNNNRVLKSNTTNGGGAMYNILSSPVIEDCKFSGNDAFVGGAVFNISSKPQFINSRFSGNSSGYRGGGVYNSQNSDPVFRYCIFSGNNSMQGGGVANSDYSRMFLINCLFYGNSGEYGGALYNERALIDLLNSTIANNTASNRGGAIESSEFIPPNAADNLSIRNTIITGNSSGVNLYNNAGKVINSLVQSITPNSSNIRFTYTNNIDGTLDPQFVNISDPDGPDNILGTIDDGYALKDISPAVNMGSNTEVSADLTTDMAGAARIQGTAVDLGAYESYYYFNCGSSTLYVDGTRSASGEGTSWASAFKTLGEALNRAGSCSNVNTILVAKGSYYPTGLQSGIDRNESFVIPQRGGIRIYGGYPNGGGNRDLLLNPTILSGDIGTIGNNSDNSYHIVVVTGVSAGADSVVIDGFTITKANANANGSQWYYNSMLTFQNEGGGVLLRQNNNFSKLAIRNCNVTGNSAASYGAGIYCGSTSALISNCISAENAGVQNGGGLFVHASNNVRISGSVMAGNNAVNGAGIFTLDANLQVVNCTVAGNTSGINNSGSSNTTIIGSVFWNNGADNIQNSSTLTISYSNMQQSGGVYSGTGNVNADPLFVNAASPVGVDGNWRTADDGLKLQGGSPAINAGPPDLTGLPLSTIDLLGQNRVYATRVDMGAYESAYIACGEISGTLYVDASVAQSGNGGSWANAFKTLNEAFLSLNSCPNINTILIAQGTYYPTNTSNRDGSFIIPARGGLKIYGGYSPGGGTRDIMSYPAVLSGDIGAIGNNSDNSYHVMTIANINAGADSIVVDGLSFTDANANGSGNTVVNGYALSQNTGGGLLIAISNGNAKIAIRNCRSFNNRANQGAGIFNLSASPYIINTVLQGNMSGDNGAGMSNYGNSRPTLINTLISGNRAGFGAAVFNDNSSPVFINSTLADNYAGEAGGTYSRGTGVNVIFRNSIIYGNRNGAGLPSNIFNISNATTSFSYSLIETATGAWESGLGTNNGNNLFSDPKFASRNEPNSGNTPNTTGDYSILSSSPVIDGGSNTFLPAEISTDLSGAARIQQASADMGAYESPHVNCNMFSVTITPSNIKCFGEKGSATATVDKGVAPFTYNWSNGANTATISDLPAGNYSCLITDANGCSLSKNISFAEPAALVVNSVQTNIKCYGGNDGAASVTASGGIAPYIYSWSNGSTSSALTGLTSGTYSNTVKDAMGCMVTQNVTIIQPAEALAATASQTNVLCYAGNTGVATVSVTGGTTPYTYSWSNGSTTASVSGLTAGSYSCTITDAAGCTIQKNFTIAQPIAALTATATHTDVNCFNGNNGTATITVNGGTAPYTYGWNNGNTTAVLNSLVAGDYDCTITDANGCTTMVDIAITQPATPLIIVKNKTDVICYGGHTGEASVTVSGGVLPYSYQWSNGATSSSVSGIAAGAYSCTITDAAGCSVVSAFNIDQPASALAIVASQTNVFCYGGSDGTAKVELSGGVAPYNYSWSNGASASSISGLGIGIYACTITDAGGCSTTRSFIITQPAALAVTGTHTDITCFNGNNGIASVSVSGGTAPYSYSWSNGATTSSLNNLSAGNYTCTVTDANGCVVSTGVLVEQPATALVVSKSQTDIPCFGMSNGAAIVNVSGGVAPYNYSWNNGSTGSRIDNIVAGSYSCTITDNKGCSLTVGFVITQPVAALTHIFSQTNVLCKDGNTGAATIDVSGGVLPYNYQWTTAGTTVTATGLTAGTYNVLVTDANGCTTGRSFTITEPAKLNAQILSTASDYCNSGRAGRATAEGNGGIAPYTYLWSNGDNDSTAKGLGAGDYTCMITDGNGCTANAVVTISNQAFPGNTIFVDSAVTVPGDGSSWLKAVRELSDAMGIATSCNGVETILVARGTYKPTGRSGINNKDSAFLIRQTGGLKIYGGYPSGGGVRNIVTNITTLSGEIGADWNISDNSGHIMVIAGLNLGADSVVVDGFTFSSGFTQFGGTHWYNGIEVDNNGGAICLVDNNDAGGKIAIRNCDFKENYSMFMGGAIHNQASSPSILNCTFTANFAMWRGGAIMNDYVSSPLLDECKFIKNDAAEGGAIYNGQGSNATIIRSRFTGNFISGGRGGGAIFNDNSVASVTSCYLDENSTRNYLPGGAIYNTNSSLKMINTVMVGNRADYGDGGGVANYDNSSVTIVSSTIYANTGIRGAIQNNGSRLTVINTILYGSPPEIWNVNGGTANVNYSLAQGWTGGGTGNLNSNLDPIFLNGNAPPYGIGDYRLAPCSPAINAGTTDTTGLDLPLIEMSYLPRVQLGRIDMGAMEANSYANGTASSLPATASSTAAYQLNNGTTWYAVDCQTLIAAVTGSGNNPVSGNTTASVEMDASLLPASVSRVYEITPANDAATASGTITLYFTQAEFTAYNAANISLHKLPLPDKDDPLMNEKFANIRIRKTSGGVTTIITPGVVNWNAGLERWELSFDVTGFSKFYVFTPDNTSLPLRLINFTAQAENCTAHIAFTTAEESGVSHFELEQSTDGSVWLQTTIIPARNTTGESRYPVNVNINSALNFYRLKMVDRDGTITYSKIIRLNAPLSCSDQNIKLYPNPAGDILYLENVHAGDMYTVYDNAGRVMIQGRISKAIQDIDATRLVMGMYTITIVNKNGGIRALKFVKK